jgi:hypothetical protein
MIAFLGGLCPNRAGIAITVNAQVEARYFQECHFNRRKDIFLSSIFLSVFYLPIHFLVNSASPPDN